MFAGSRDSDYIGMLNIGRLAHARGLARVQKLVHGTRNKKDKDLYKALLGETETVGGFDAIISKMSQKDLDDLMLARINEWSPGEAKANIEDLSGVTVNLMRRLQQVDNHYHSDVIPNLKKILPPDHPLHKMEPLENHYLISRSWFGDWRVPIYRAKPAQEGLSDEVIGYASGYGRKDALEEANRLTAKLNEDSDLAFNVGFRKGDAAKSGRDKDLENVRRLRGLSLETQARFKKARAAIFPAGQPPVRYRQSTGMKGYSETLRKDELRNKVIGNLIETERMVQANLLNHFLGNRFTQLQMRDPRLAADLAERLGHMQGGGSKMWKNFDDVLNPVLAPFFGRDAVKTLADSSNKIMFDWTLGFYDIGFAAVNAVTPILTGLPELAFVMGATPKQLSRYYQINTVMGPETGINAVSSISPMRMMSAALKDMGKPSADLKKAFYRAIDEGVVDPKMVEEFIGETSKTVKSVKEVLQGDAGFLKWLRESGRFMANQSEKFTRGVSFTMGYNVGKDFLRLQGDDLYNFATQFTARTNFLYSTADRAKLMTGSVGQTFGLFKNWGMHQLGNMLVYGGEAALRGNVKPLVYMMGTNAVIGGVGSLPFYGAADSISRLLSDESLLQNIYEGSGWVGTPDEVTDTFMYGLPAFAGLTVQSRVTPLGNEFARDVSFQMQSATFDRMKYLTGAIGDSVDRWVKTGVFPLTTEKDRLQWYRALLPRTMYRSLSLTENRSIQSMRNGNSLTSPLNMPYAASYMLGLSPISVAKENELADHVWKDNAYRKELTTQLGELWLEASKVSVEEGRKIRSMVIKRAVEAGIDLSSVYLSSATQQRNAEGSSLERRSKDYSTISVNNMILRTGRGGD